MNIKWIEVPIVDDIIVDGYDNMTANNRIYVASEDQKILMVESLNRIAIYPKSGHPMLILNPTNVIVHYEDEEVGDGD